MKRSILRLITAAVSVAAHWAGTSAFANGADFTPLSKPQYKLYSVCSNKIDASKEDLRLIAENFEFYHGKFQPEQADAIREINPAFKCLTYINSTYTQSEADVRLVESQYRDCLSMLVAARLSQSIEAGSTKFRVEPAGDGQKSGGKEVPIPIRASTIAGDYSSIENGKPSTKFYVFWIRIGDELMRVNQFIPATGDIEVARSFAGTASAAHPAKANVFSPVYLGFDRSPKSKESANTSSRGNYPNGHDDKLRYVLDPAYRKGYLFQGETVLKAMQENRVDGVWMDTLNTGTFNLSDCLGRAAAGKVWDFAKNQPYAPDDFRLGQEKKVAYIGQFINERLGKFPFLVANNLTDAYAPGRGGLKLLLMATEVKPRPLDAYCMEGGLELQSPEKWKKRIVMLMDAAQSGLAAAPIWANAGSPSYAESEPDTPGRDKAERFGYASYLLGVEKEGKTLMGTYAFYQANGKRFVKIHPMYYYPIGYPAVTVKPNEFGKYLMKDVPVYHRSFTNGLVLVNSSDQDCPVKLEETYFDPDTRQLVTTVTMSAGTGKILLNKP
jgi:hypothetical protein